MPDITKRLLSEVAETVLKGGTALFLTPGFTADHGDLRSQAEERQKRAERVADLFRKAFIEKAMELRKCAEITARKLLRPEGVNPIFIQMVEGETGWVFFYPNVDISPDDDIGTPAFVYWPTPSLDYQKIPYLSWRRERAGSLWRPANLKGSLPWEDGSPAAPHRPMDGWAALLDDDL